ncbi:MAG: alpha/beta hydrolase [Thermoanaerobaculia bacterium]
MKHRRIRLGEIAVSCREQGEGELVVLLHGFPELSGAWHHQLAALAAAGFRAVAPDLRGYGGSDAPEDPGAYDLLRATGDVVGLVQALGAERALVAGHDWGAQVAAHCGLLRPDLFPAVALLGVPFTPRLAEAGPPSDRLRAAAGEEGQIYALRFLEEGAEAELEADVRDTLLRFYHAASGDASEAERFPVVYPKGRRLLEVLARPAEPPSWLDPDELDLAVATFERTGFRGPLAWYRAADLTHERTAFLEGARLRVPTLFLAGERDPVLAWRRGATERIEDFVPGLVRKMLFPGAGHWIQQERAEDVSRELVDFARRALGDR